jgi:hypothetical protein
MHHEDGFIASSERHAQSSESDAFSAPTLPSATTIPRVRATRVIASAHHLFLLRRRHERSEQCTEECWLECALEQSRRRDRRTLLRLVSKCKEGEEEESAHSEERPALLVKRGQRCSNACEHGNADQRVRVVLI